MYEDTLYHKSINYVLSVDEQVENNINREIIKNAINELPDIQQRRLKKYFFRKILLFGNDKSKSNTTSEIMEYYDNKGFNSDDVYDISRGTDKEDELFDYAKIPSDMKSNKKSYNEKDKDDYDFSR